MKAKWGDAVYVSFLPEDFPAVSEEKGLPEAAKNFLLYELVLAVEQDQLPGTEYLAKMAKETSSLQITIFRLQQRVEAVGLPPSEKADIREVPKWQRTSH